VPSPNTGFIAIATGFGHSLGLKTDGSIVAWGDNYYGQCTVPSPNTGFIAIATGLWHSLGLKTDGSIVSWGRNEYGQCTLPSPNTGFTAIAAGGYHSLGLKTDGSIVAWGDNYYGQCTVLSPNTGFTSIAAGLEHSLALVVTYTITAAAGDNGSIEPAGEVVAYQGENKLFTATSSTGYGVDTWYVDGNVAQTVGNTYTLTNITTVHTVYVTFRALPSYTITAAAGDNGSIEPAGEVVTYQGDNKLFTATGSTGYGVETWYVDGNVAQTGGNTYTLTNITTVHTVYVTFLALPSYTVTAAAGDNGSIEPAGEVVAYQGDNKLFTATANPGYLVGTWYVDDNNVQQGGTTYTLHNVQGSHTVHVTFNKAVLNIISQTYSVSGDADCYYGRPDSYSLSANYPVSGYAESSWEGEAITAESGSWSSIEAASFSCGVSQSSNWWGLPGYSYASASLSIQFTATAKSQLRIHPEGLWSSYTYINATFKDLTINHEYDIVLGDNYCESWSGQIQVSNLLIPIDPSHIYEISMNASDCEGGGGSISFGFEVSPFDSNRDSIVHHVDINSPNDPGIGTIDDPYRRIQDAIYSPHVIDGDTVVVMPGTYYENILFGGKAITLVGASLYDPNITGASVIDGSQPVDSRIASVIEFLGIENNNSVLKGFSLTGGTGMYSTDESSMSGGAVYGNGSSAIIENCLIVDNSSDGCGIIYDFNGLLKNCTIADDTERNYVLYRCDVEIRNCIVWGNGEFDLSYIVPTYSCMQGFGAPDSYGNFEADPLFVNPSIEDYHLLPYSPCIDAGDPCSDFGLEPEPDGGRINMGAYGNTPEATTKGGLAVESYNLVSRTRVGRTLFDYIYTVTMANHGAEPVCNVYLELLDASGNVSITDPNVTFASIDAAASETSGDTFSIRVDRSTPIDVTTISWRATFEFCTSGTLGTQVFTNNLVLEPEVLASDITMDCKVDYEDLEKMAEQWLGPPGTPSADIAPLPGGDGIVDFLDFARLAMGWMQ
jgi:hypothetical protein